jgi:4-hydroxy-2-oxoheptanedioate aldolase
MLKVNTLKNKLNNGEVVVGTWNTLASPLVTEVFAQAGLDFQIIDLEHGPFILDQIHLHVSACETVNNCTPLVRIPANSDWMALQALDQGAHGIVTPHINSAESARQLVNATKYYPNGDRGFTPFSKAGGFNNDNILTHIKRSIDETINIVIIESKEGLDNLEQIASTDSIDVVYFGAYDLSQALGYPGEIRHPNIIKEIKKGVNIVNKLGKHSGGFVAQSKGDINELVDMGMRFITYEVDSSIIYSHVKGMTDWLKNGR